MRRYIFLLTGLLLIILFVGGVFYFMKKPKASQVPQGYEKTLSISQEGIEVEVYSKGKRLDVGKNILYILIKPPKDLKELYFYMPPMPGMGEMREDATIKKTSPGLYELQLNISMAGSWQMVAVIDQKVIKRDLSIPFTGEEKMPAQEKKEGVISVDVNKLQLIGIQTQEVKREELVESFSTVGYVSYDLSRVYEVTLRGDAWILDTFGRFEGEFIRKGTPLMRVLNPDVNIAREELRLAEELKREDLKRAALQKLSYLKAGDVISSPYSGVIVERKVYEGGFLRAGDTAYKIADISKVWVIAEVPQVYAGSVRKGMRVLVSPVGQEESYEGIVDYIFPEADKMARTIKVRISLPNRGAKLKINQMVDVYFERPLGHVLAVPEDAVVDTGKRKVVFVEREPGLYEPRNVRLGRKAQGYYEVLEGLREGEKVVVRGAFLLDSEAQLKGLYGEKVKGHEHHH